MIHPPPTLAADWMAEEQSDTRNKKYFHDLLYCNKEVPQKTLMVFSAFLPSIIITLNLPHPTWASNMEACCA